MQKRFAIMSACLAVMSGWMVPSSASGVIYTFRVLQPPPPPANNSSIAAVNANGSTVGGTYNGLASIYTGTNLGTRVSLNPTSAAIGGSGSVTSSGVRAVHGNLQAGFATATGIGYQAGVVWNGTAASATKLNAPAGRSANHVVVSGLHGTTVVGSAYDSGFTAIHAVVWPGSVDGTGKFVNGTPVNLNPSGFTNSYLSDFDGTTRVGGARASGFIETPGFWTSNSAASFTTVGAGVPSRWGNPGSYFNVTTNSAELRAVSGNRMVGIARLVDGTNIRDDATRAVLYTSITAGATPVSLHPTTVATSGGGGRYVYDRSEALDVNGQYVVGRVRRTPGASGANTVAGPFSGATQGGLYSAAVWNSTAASFVDLTQFIPTSLFGPNGSTGSAGTYGRLGNSEATSIDEFGNVYGTVFVLGTPYAAVWYIPEPSALGLLAPGLAMLGRRRRSRV